MTEEEWRTNPYAEQLCFQADADDLWTARKARLLVCDVYRLLGDRLTDTDHEVLRVAEQMADGRAKWIQLCTAVRGTGWLLDALIHRERLTTWDVWDVIHRCRGPATREPPQFHIVYPPNEAQAALVRDIFGNPVRPVAFDPSWRSDTVLSLARVMYETRDFTAMPILADAL
ncbi:MAG TPA: hypothetical protein VMZ71_09610, partial [Gemmataceae bacterium]|nr:hypothetical protein [Gemmataceae bacterium]